MLCAQNDHLSVAVNPLESDPGLSMYWQVSALRERSFLKTSYGQQQIRIASLSSSHRAERVSDFDKLSNEVQIEGAACSKKVRTVYFSREIKRRQKAMRKEAPSQVARGGFARKEGVVGVYRGGSRVKVYRKRASQAEVVEAYSMSWCKLRCTIISCTLFIVLSSRLVSVALV